MSGSPANLLKDRLRAKLKDAMKAGRKGDAGVIRTLLAAIDNAEAPAQTSDQASAASAAFGSGAAEVGRLELSSKDLDAIIAAEADSRDAAADDMARHGQAERAQMLRAEAALVRSYLA